VEAIGFGLGDLGIVVGIGGVAVIFLMLSPNIFSTTRTNLPQTQAPTAKIPSIPLFNLVQTCNNGLCSNLGTIYQGNILEAKCLNVEQDAVFISVFEFKSNDSLHISLINSLLAENFQRYAP